MTARAKLTLPTGKLDALYRAVNEARKGSSMVKVEKEALWGLLQDHSKLIDALKGKVEGEGVTR